MCECECVSWLFIVPSDFSFLPSFFSIFFEKKEDNSQMTGVRTANEDNGDQKKKKKTDGSKSSGSDPLFALFCIFIGPFLIYQLVKDAGGWLSTTSKKKTDHDDKKKR